MAQPPHDLILHKPERALADDAGCTVAEVHAVLDQHPITVDRDKHLKRALAMQLLQLDHRQRRGHTSQGISQSVQISGM